MIDIRDHGGNFGGGKNSPFSQIPMLVANLGVVRGASLGSYSTVTFLAMNKKYIVLNVTTSQLVAVIDRKTFKVIKTFKAHPGDTGFYVDTGKKGLLLNDKWLIYPVKYTSAGNERMIRINIEDTTQWNEIYVATQFTHVWQSTDETYGFLCFGGDLYKFDMNGVVWNVTQSALGLGANFEHIYGERNGKLYGHTNTSGYIYAVNVSDGSKVFVASGYWQQAKMGFIIGDKLYSQGSDAITRVNLITDTSPWISTNPIAQLSNTVSIMRYDKAGTKMLVGRNSGGVTPSFASDLYDFNLVKLEENTAGGATTDVQFDGKDELFVIAENYYGATGNGELNAPYMLIMGGK